MFMERWGLAAGCGDSGLVDSGKTQVKGLKNIGREEVPFRDCIQEERMKEDRVLGLFLIQSLAEHFHP